MSSVGYQRVSVLKIRSTHNRLGDLPVEGCTAERPPAVGHCFVVYVGPDEIYPEGETIWTSRIQAVRQTGVEKWEIDTHNSTYQITYLDRLN